MFYKVILMYFLKSIYSKILFSIIIINAYVCYSYSAEQVDNFVNFTFKIQNTKEQITTVTYEQPFRLNQQHINDSWFTSLIHFKKNDTTIVNLKFTNAQSNKEEIASPESLQLLISPLTFTTEKELYTHLKALKSKDLCQLMTFYGSMLLPDTIKQKIYFHFICKWFVENAEENFKKIVEKLYVFTEKNPYHETIELIYLFNECTEQNILKPLFYIDDEERFDFLKSLSLEELYYIHQKYSACKIKTPITEQIQLLFFVKYYMESTRCSETYNVAKTNRFVIENAINSVIRVRDGDPITRPNVFFDKENLSEKCINSLCPKEYKDILNLNTSNILYDQLELFQKNPTKEILIYRILKYFYFSEPNYIDLTYYHYSMPRFFSIMSTLDKVPLVQIESATISLSELLGRLDQLIEIFPSLKKFYIIENAPDSPDALRIHNLLISSLKFGSIEFYIDEKTIQKSTGKALSAYKNKNFFKHDLIIIVNNPKIDPLHQPIIEKIENAPPHPSKLNHSVHINTNYNREKQLLYDSNVSFAQYIILKNSFEYKEKMQRYRRLMKIMTQPEYDTPSNSYNLFFSNLTHITIVWISLLLHFFKTISS
jgi:hypothetical protein